MPQLSYNELSPQTQEALKIIGHLWYDDRKKWYKGFDKLITPTYNAISGALELRNVPDTLTIAEVGAERHFSAGEEKNHWLNIRIEIDEWLKVIAAYDLLTDDINEELMPGSKKPLPKPYPHICYSCKCAARKIGKIVLCSNDKCKTKKLIKAVYK